MQKVRLLCPTLHCSEGMKDAKPILLRCPLVFWINSHALSRTGLSVNKVKFFEQWHFVTTREFSDIIEQLGLNNKLLQQKKLRWRRKQISATGSNQPSFESANAVSLSQKYNKKVHGKGNFHQHPCLQRYTGYRTSPSYWYDVASLSSSCHKHTCIYTFSSWRITRFTMVCQTC